VEFTIKKWKIRNMKRSLTKSLLKIPCLWKD
jgi:hypothetical protein